MFLKNLINKGYEATQCELCGLRFNLMKFSRIHKCKRCNKYICTNCGTNKEQVIDQQGRRTQEKHRICLSCKSDNENIKTTIRNYDMGWGRDSALALKWRASIQKFNRGDFEYQHFLNLFFRGGQYYAQQTQIIDKDVIKGRTDFNVFNYSVKQFFYTIQEHVDDQVSTRQDIAHVLYAIAARFGKIGYCQGMSGIAALLLCFATKQSAYIIFCDLLQNIFPHGFFQRSSYGVALFGMLAEIYFLKEYYQYFVRQVKKQLLQQVYSAEDMQHTKMIIELTGSKALLSIFIGVLNFTNLMFLWEELKKQRSFQVVQRAFLAIIYINRNNILIQRSYKALQDYFQKIDPQIFQETYFDIQIDQVLRKKHIQEFYKQTSKKWNSSNTGNNYTLSTVTNFTQKQVKDIQKVFCKSFSGNDFVTKSVITNSDFVRLVQGYFRILRRESYQGESILQMNPQFLSVMFASFVTEGRQGLLFRELVICLSLCTKGELKDRIFAVISAFENEENLITLQAFDRSFSLITSIAPMQLQIKRFGFNQRKNEYFRDSKGLTHGQLQRLLQDQFILEMGGFVRSQCEGIIGLMLKQYTKDEVQQQNQIILQQQSNQKSQKNIDNIQQEQTQVIDLNHRNQNNNFQSQDLLGQVIGVSKPTLRQYKKQDQQLNSLENMDVD